MDPIANDSEQKEVSARIMDLWDECPDDGNLTQRQLEELAQLGYRLAELVQAMADWRQSTGRRPVGAGF